LNQPRYSPDGPVVAWLAVHRSTLLAIYLLALAGFVLPVVLFGNDEAAIILGPWIIVEAVHGAFGWLRGDAEPWLGLLRLFRAAGDLSSGLAGFILLAAFFGVQAALIWGGGKVRLERSPARFRKMGVAILAFSILALILTIGLVLLVIEFADWRRTRVLDSTSETAWLYAMLYAIASAWVFWLAMGWLYARGRPQVDVLQRFLAIIFAGSWIEFMLALPIDIAARNRESCYCVTGSFLLMLMTVPLMICAMGPALYLFYLREQRADAQNPGRARRILQWKTRRGPRKSGGTP